MLSTIVFTLTILGTTTALPTGPPVEVCDSSNTTIFMTPSPLGGGIGHGAVPQTGPSPFKVEPQKNTVKPDGTVTVVVSGLKEIEGLMLYPRKLGSSEPLGYFETTGSEDFQTLCENGLDNAAVSHKRKLHEKSYTFTYVAKGAVEGEVIEILSTIVEEEYEFWVQTPATTTIRVVAKSSAVGLRFGLISILLAVFFFKN